MAHRTEQEITIAGIQLLLEYTATTLDVAHHAVTVINGHGQVKRLTYDRLIIATGATPVRPTLPGIVLPGVYLLRSMEESFAVNEHLRTHHPRSAVIICGGYIGMEMADALTHQGLAVTVVEHGESVLKTIDQRLGQMVGHWHAEVAKRIDVFATALFHGIRVEDLNDLDFIYTPPLSSPWDPIQSSAQAWIRSRGSSHDVVRTH